MRKIKLFFMAMVGLFYIRKTRVFLPLNVRLSGLKYIEIGSKFGAGSGFWLEAINCYAGKVYTPNIIIGDNVSFSDYCHVSSINRVVIGKNVLIGSRVHITDLSHGLYNGMGSKPDEAPIGRSLFSKGSVEIDDNVWIGDGVVVLPGASIGKGCIIGANSVVSHSIPENSIAVGIPAKVIKIYHEGAWINI